MVLKIVGGTLVVIDLKQVVGYLYEDLRSYL